MHTHTHTHTHSRPENKAVTNALTAIGSGLQKTDPDSQDDEVLERDVCAAPVNMNESRCVHHLVADLQQAEHPAVDVGIWGVGAAKIQSWKLGSDA